MRASIPLLALLLTTPAWARPPVQKLTGSPSGAWSPQRATGAPDAQAGDHVNAWATLRADAGAEWLELEYDRFAPILEVRIHENHNPGAVTRVSAVDDEGRETIVWEGVEPVRPEPNVFVVKGDGQKARRLRIHLDTTRVTGWNEIDAVELVGIDGGRQWATRAKASSSYSSVAPTVDPLTALVGEQVRVELAKRTLTGRLTHAGGAFLVLKIDGNDVLVGKAAVQTLVRAR